MAGSGRPSAESTSRSVEDQSADRSAGPGRREIVDPMSGWIATVIGTVAWVTGLMLIIVMAALPWLEMLGARRG